MRLLAAVLLVLFAGVSSATAADLAKGKKVFSKCKACHAVGPKAKNKIGPLLNGVVGREWGIIEGYKYSKGKEGSLLFITEAETQTWNVEILSAYLRKPKDVIPKSKMSFPGLKKDEDVENVIFYLAQFDAEGNEVDPEAVLAALAEAAE
jgi:cytochrome c